MATSAPPISPVVETKRPRLSAGWLLVGLVGLALALRLWHLGQPRLFFDETFEAMVARRSLGPMLDFLRAQDQHPPLDYLLRAPFAATGSDIVLRLPSVVWSTAAIAVFAVWMRARGKVGVLATALMAISGFEIFYGREARMYALLILVGVTSAAAADRWLHEPRRAHLWTVSISLLIAAFASVSGLLLAAGLFWLPGLRRDRDAWRWRLAVSSPAVLWAVVWGPSALQQLRHDPAQWIDPTSLQSVLEAVGQPVTLNPGLAWIAVAIVAVGAVYMWLRDRPLAVVGLCAFVLPLLMAAAIGSVTHFFIPRTIAFGSWAPLTATAYAIDQLIRRRLAVGGAVVALVAIIMLPSTRDTLNLTTGDELVTALHALQARVQPGDIVAAHPAWLGPEIAWKLGVQRAGQESEIPGPTSDSYALRLDSEARASGRIWLLERKGDEARLDHPPCAHPWEARGLVLRCFRLNR